MTLDGGPADQVAVVTGGSAGIGFGIAAALGTAGARVAVWGRRAHRNEAACERLRELGIVAEPVVCDVSVEADVEAATAATINRLGRIDVMVANAGTSTHAPLIEMSLEDWDHVIRTDLTGVFLCFRAAARELRSREAPGALIAVASVAAMQAQPGMANYAAAKAGLLGLVRSVAAELAPFRIRCNALTPGFTDTDGLSFQGASARMKVETLSAIPAGRWATPDDLGAAARFLADPALSIHTGDNLVVDGGYSTLPGYLAVRAAWERSAEPAEDSAGG